MSKCHVIQCPNNTYSLKNGSCFRLPRDCERAAKWVQFAGFDESYKPPVNFAICQMHFSDLQIYKRYPRPLLLRDAIPTLLGTFTNLDLAEDMQMGCCVPGCPGNNIRRHRFPHPKKEQERYMKWIKVLGCKKLLETDSKVVYNAKRVCGDHFENWCTSAVTNRLRWDSVPTLRLSEPDLEVKSILQEIASQQLAIAANQEQINEVIIENNISEELGLTNKFTDITTLVSFKLSKSTISNPSPEQLRLLCRTCLADTNLRKISELTYKGALIIKLLETCSTIQIEDDEFSQNICMDCIENLTRSLTFTETCKESDILFKKVKQQKLEEVNLTMMDHNYNKQLDQKMSVTKQIVPNDFSKLDSTPISLQPSAQEGIKKRRKVRFQCELCGIDMRLKKKLIKHLWSHKDPKALAQLKELDPSSRQTLCEICGEVLPSRDLFIDHKSEHGSEVLERLTCKKCGEECHDRDDFAEHLKMHRNIHSCEICNRRYYSMWHLKKHLVSHVRPTSCEICGKTFVKAHGLKRHMMLHTGERPYVCEKCGKGFVESAAFRRHHKLHDLSTISPMNCPFCGKHFRFMKLWKAHLLIHTDEPVLLEQNENERKYVCEVCNASFYTPERLKLHKLRHGPKKFLCNICGKRFVFNAPLQTHLRTHTGERPYQCNICGKTFTQIVGLRTHKFVHTGLKVYRCESCPKSFVQSAQLKTHMRTHTGEKPYQCEVCPKSFGTNGNLTVHRRIHTGETPFMCSICGKGFYDSSNLRKHSKVHSELERDVKLS